MAKKAAAKKPAKKQAAKAKAAPAPKARRAKKTAAGNLKQDAASIANRETMFVAEYLVSMNATRAAIRAGYSPETAAQIGYQLLHKPSVSEAIAKAQQDRLQRLSHDADYLLDRLREELDADISEIYDPVTGFAKHPLDWPPVFRRGLVPGVETEELFAGSGDNRTLVGQVVKIKHSDRNKLKRMYGDHIRIQAFKQTVKHDVADPLKQLFEQIAGNSIRPKV